MWFASELFRPLTSFLRAVAQQRGHSSPCTTALWFQWWSLSSPAHPSSMATIFKRARTTSYSRNDAIFVLGELLLIDANGGRTSVTPGGSMLVESWIPVFSVADPMPTSAPPPPSSSTGTAPSTLIPAPVDPTTLVMQELPPPSTRLVRMLIPPRSLVHIAGLVRLGSTIPVRISRGAWRLGWGSFLSLF